MEGSIMQKKILSIVLVAVVLSTTMSSNTIFATQSTEMAVKQIILPCMEKNIELLIHKTSTIYPTTCVQEEDTRIPIIYLYEKPEGYLAIMINHNGQVILEEDNILMSFEEAIIYLYDQVLPIY